MLVLHNTSQAALELAGLTVRRIPLESLTAKLDLTLSLVEQGEGLCGTLEYNTDLFEAATIRRLGEHFRVLLEGIVTDPERPIGTLPLLTAAERQQLVVDWNRPARVSRVLPTA
jgi:non-ribosomal peptide synthetase component F